MQQKHVATIRRVLTSNSSIIGAVRTLVEKVKYFARCSYLIEIRTASVAPVGTAGCVTTKDLEFK